MAKSEEELKSLLMKVKRRVKKLNIQKTKIMASCQFMTDEEAMEAVTGFISLSSKITADGDCSHEIKKLLLLIEKL